ncbi:PilW family protein [Stenotrophomonas sp.]|uniref:PilW family protein n=1 Tax=Stenotrophomonas sp. TaxID=69392 RepID=UPI002D5D2C6E|nr:PilW family protein [Stenotrophomonas sp.]HYQ24208.1 PilW family protein [Stenotrophomonas sp.]
MKNVHRPRSATRGLSLIELMISMVIGLIIMLAVVQVFAASREAYRLSEGLARVQENSRFAMDTLQREIRMAGHFGCVNDQAQTSATRVSLRSTLDGATNPVLDFNRSIQGYEATDTGPGKTLAIKATPDTGGTAYSPALPDAIANALSNRVDGSDIIALRYLMPDGVPVTSIGGDASKPVFNFDASRLSVLRSGVANPGLYGVADCSSATVFQASAVNATSASVTFNTVKLNGSRTFVEGYTVGQANLYRAESAVYYVGYDADTRQRSLYRVRFSATPGGDLAAGAPEPLVEGVDNLQLLYGQDRNLDTPAPSGYIDRQGTAKTVQESLPADVQLAWRRVGAVQIGLLMSSPDPASARQSDGAAALIGMGVTYTPPTDGRMRAVYQTSVALRNRLYGN